MIELTAWSGEQFYLNPDMIVRIDERPDTVITLNDGTPIVVRNTAKEAVERITEYRRMVFSRLLDVNATEDDYRSSENERELGENG
ncbi:flagellar FlbD family protein [Ligilactobacillus sp.]|uniref:flagellar FlbD family protein n=1 Tax=Ligilactobacillus sp. TaxID=2767921 RepID=UPI002FE3E014